MLHQLLLDSCDGCLVSFVPLIKALDFGRLSVAIHKDLLEEDQGARGEVIKEMLCISVLNLILV